MRFVCVYHNRETYDGENWMVNGKPVGDRIEGAIGKIFLMSLEAGEKIDGIELNASGGLGGTLPLSEEASRDLRESLDEAVRLYNTHFCREAK